MKRIEKRLKELTDVILNGGDLPEETYVKSVAELKALRELIATKKALASYVEDYGDDDENEPRQKRTSDTEWH